MIAGWLKLANRYANKGNILGADLKNEPYLTTVRGCTTPVAPLITLRPMLLQWGDGAVTDWSLGASRIGNAILNTSVGWLIVVEGGVSSPSCGDCFWGESACPSSSGRPAAFTQFTPLHQISKAPALTPSRSTSLIASHTRPTCECGSCHGQLTNGLMSMLAPRTHPVGTGLQCTCIRTWSTLPFPRISSPCEWLLQDGACMRFMHQRNHCTHAPRR